MLPGFELLFSSVQSQFRSPQDALVSAVHWNVISAGFKLTGVGENPTVMSVWTVQLFCAVWFYFLFSSLRCSHLLRRSALIYDEVFFFILPMK